jgi:hypothetical protein
VELPVYCGVHQPFYDSIILAGCKAIFRKITAKNRLFPETIQFSQLFFVLCPKLVKNAIVTFASGIYNKKVNINTST